MYDYILSANAKEDLKRIYAYGLAEFGEQQADEYFYDLFGMFEKIKANPYIYQTVDHIRAGYRRFTCDCDSIYYRINGTTVEIMAILGGQDLGDWL
jgi:toxin ParE1/3/4